MTNGTFSTATEPEQLDVERLTATMRAIMAADPRPGPLPYLLFAPMPPPDPDPWGDFGIRRYQIDSPSPMFIIHHEETTAERFDRWMSRVEESIR